MDDRRLGVKMAQFDRLFEQVFIEVKGGSHWSSSDA
jgi:hypothetical protein